MRRAIPPLATNGGVCFTCATGADIDNFRNKLTSNDSGGLVWFRGLDHPAPYQDHTVTKG